MSERRTRSGGAARRSGPRAPSLTKGLQRSQRKSGSDLPSVLPELWRKAPHVVSARKPIVLKKIVAHAVELPAVQSPRRSPRIAFFLEKENNPPKREPAREELFKSCSVPGTPATTPVLCSLNTSSNAKEGQLDARDLEMSQKVRRSYSRLDTLGSLSTSTPGRRSCFGFEGAEDLSRVSPVVGSKPAEASRVPAKPWAPDTALPGISPLVVREKRKKKKVPQILSPRSRRTAHSKSALRPPEKPEDAQAAVEGSTESPYSKQKSDKEVEPTVTFLFTLLNTPEPAEPTLPDPDLEIQEKRFLDQEDWGSQQTSREIRCLQDDCARLREALKTNQVDNLELKKKLQNLDPCLCLGPTPPRSPASGDVAGVSFPAWPCRPLLQPASLYESLKAGAKAIRAEVSAIRAEVRAAQEEALAVQEAMLSQMHTQQQQVGREGRLPGTARSSSLRLYLQPPSSRRAARLVLLPEVPLDHRGQGQPWPGPRPETGHLLGKALGQLNPP
ncbi:sororin isoform X2 [Oryctolagus cuniculus]|uniref:sororin isoform X2 n=1 Tax=Oryctolagus cuniculus TaxID=9986 RepID=UPI0038799B81